MTLRERIARTIEPEAFRRLDSGIPPTGDRVMDEVEIGPGVHQCTLMTIALPNPLVDYMTDIQDIGIFGETLEDALVWAVRDFVIRAVGPLVPSQQYGVERRPADPI